MERKNMMYEGKAKRVYETEKLGVLVQEFKDDATAFNGEKKDNIIGKGVVNNTISSAMFTLLEKSGVPTHFLEKLSDTNMLIKKVEIIQLEVIIRNIAAGSFSRRYGVDEGYAFKIPTVEFSYKNDDLGDPLMNEYHAIALNLATMDEINKMKDYAFKINNILKKYFEELGITLVDFKLEFGRLSDGRIILADEISPDTCRFWDKKTGKKLDKDIFRQNLGDLMDGYKELLSRIENK